MTETSLPASVTAGMTRTRTPLLRICAERASLEIKQFFREKAQVLMIFMMPAVMLILLATIFKSDIAPGVSSQQLYVTGMLGVGLMSTSFQSVILQVVGERANGTLKRLRTTPMPKTAYFAGKVAMVLAASIGQAVMLTLVGTVFFDLKLPSDAGRWVTFGWVYLLAVTSCTLLGLAYSSFVPVRSAGAMVFPPILVLQFISGVFIPFNQLPHGLQIAASFFPMKWICQGMRSVFLPDSLQSLETGGSWHHGQIALVLAVYSVVGLAICSRTFRWRGRADG